MLALNESIEQAAWPSSTSLYCGPGQILESPMSKDKLCFCALQEYPACNPPVTLQNEQDCSSSRGTNLLYLVCIFCTYIPNYY
jgi:hypothetical protein